jgi:hypothetical protein
MFNREQLEGIIRHALTAVGGYMIAKGLMDEATTTQIIGGASTLVGVIWSWWAKLKSE